MEYFPSGETFVENHLNSYNVPYKFNAKELDDETGYYYYGARYYNPRVSLFLNVDPSFEKYPSWSPYVYTFNNPINLVDPDGRDPGKPWLHTYIDNLAKKWSLNASSVEWTNRDIIKWKTTGGDSYLFQRKTEFVNYYRAVIKDAAKANDIPEFLLVGVAFNEFGGDLSWIDNAAYNARAFDWSGPNWIDNNLTVTKNPELTSFGNLSTQVRRASVDLGYENPTSAQKGDIISTLENPVTNIYVAAMHLGELKNIDFKGKSASQLTKEDIQVIGTGFNRGPDLPKAKILQNTGYGQKIYKHEKEINKAMYGK